ncbi:interleukin 17-like protein [Liolophura sinensis]|uniref:interleukin 17-like protein n=1 Tax=Liolophura sinensis TaxID=3198878 RepID=UPI003157F83D
MSKQQPTWQGNIRLAVATIDMKGNNRQIKVFWIFILMVLNIESHVTGSPVPCQQPGNNTLKNQWMRLHSAQNASTLVSRQASRVATIIESSKTSGRTCPTTLSTDPNQPEERRSLCPWSYRINHDPTRYPVDLPEAFCLCSNCISNRINTCEAVYYEVPVLRQTQQCNSGSYVYEETFQKIAVGCTCTQPRLAIAQPIQRSGPDPSGF